VHTTSETVVRGVTGQSIQLPCFYHVAKHKGTSDMCWGRGSCPNSKCNNKILHTTGNRVTFRKSQRYNLKGYISYGDVSLTIEELKAGDAGTYCCRVEISGWFNDIKRNIRLEVRAMPSTTRKVPVSPKHFRKTTSAPQETSDHPTTETPVLLTTNIPPATTPTTVTPTVIPLETVAPTTFAETENDYFQETMMITSALPHFPCDFQYDVGAEDDYVFSDKPDPLPEVTTEFPSTLLTSEESESAYSPLTMEDLP
ncbi:TIMD4 protein, partial [Rhinopomastus cyanomelas]|nr:TIMD4 protein [Rhinopomastus cyanomelas]